MFQLTQVVLIALCLTGALTGILSSVTGAVEDAVLNLMPVSYTHLDVYKRQS